MYLGQISENLSLMDSGIWRSAATRDISYPMEGNEICFSIENDSFWYQHRSSCIVEAIRAHRPDGAIVDVGGGNGIVSLELQRQGMDVYLLEPGYQGVLNAKKRGLRHVINSSLEDAGFKPSVLPAVGLFDVLEHIEDDAAFLQLINRILVRGGKLYLSVPAYNFLWSRNDEHLGHFRRYSLSTLTQRLKSAGFIPDYLTYYFQALPLPIFLTRTLPGKLGFFKEISPEHKRREHGVKSKRLRSIVARSLKREVRCIRRQKQIRFGASCLVVASKA